MLQSTQSGSERAFDFMAKYGIHGVIGSGSAEGGAVERTCSASSSRLAPHSAAGPRRRGASHRRSSARPNDCFDQRQGRAPGGRTGRTSWRGGGIGGREGGGGWASAPRIGKPIKTSAGGPRSFFDPAPQCPFAYLGAGPAEPCGWVIVGPMLGTVLPRLNMHAAKALSYCAWIDL